MTSRPPWSTSSNRAASAAGASPPRTDRRGRRGESALTPTGRASGFGPLSTGEFAPRRDRTYGRDVTGVSKRVVALLCAVSAAFVLVEAAPALAAHDPAFVRAFGALGTPTCTTSCTEGSDGAKAGQFNYPDGMAVSGSGDVYVAESGNNRVSEFSPAGAFVRAFGKDVGGSGVDVCTSSCVAGSAGGDAGSARLPRGGGGERVGRRLCRRHGKQPDRREFSQAGVFVRAFGKDVSGSGGDVCEAGESCQAGSAGGGAGRARRPARGGGERDGRRLCRATRTTSGSTSSRRRGCSCRRSARTSSRVAAMCARRARLARRAARAAARAS